MDYMVNSIMMFQKEDESSFWSEPLFHFYPQLDKAYVFKLSPREKSEYDSYKKWEQKQKWDSYDKQYK